MPSRLFKIREKINLRIFTSKTWVIGLFRVLSVFAFLIVLAYAVYYYGFPRTARSMWLNETAMEYSLAFFSLRYLVYLFYDFHPLDFLKSNWREGSILLFFLLYILIPSAFNWLFVDYSIGAMMNGKSMVLLQIYFISIILLELIKSGPKIARLNLKPASLLILSFIILIASGTGLLMLPEMTVGGHFNFLNALFTSTSASCVTGLIVVDTATFFTFKGQLVIMLLIQLGGINIISFATFFITFSRSTGGLKYQSMLKDVLSSDRLSDTSMILRSIIKFSLISESIGTLFLYFSWGNIHFDSWKNQFFHSIFQAVSAFNNAGFSTFTNNLYEQGVRQLYSLQIVIILLIFFGGFGFIAIQDAFSFSSIKTRLRLHWKRLNVSTKITLYMSLFLISLGAIVFYLLEKNSVLAGQNWYQATITSVFQSVTTRTAGFNTVDFTKLGTPILVFFMFLMFVGAGPGSTGGGIKVTTFAVIIKSAIATIKGEKTVVFFKRTVPFNTIDRAYSIALFSISMIFLSAFLLTITDPHISFIKLIFEEISAFGTVGLSTGITATLSAGGKIIIIASMFVGRIGTLTLAMALSSRAFYTNYRYAKTSVMVG